ncbi:MAG: hypothetical protein QNJ54_01180 [Prochloraceae cyanobacterium]|nr:hypothetical protein [Prochloraceae cyanobacterium]
MTLYKKKYRIESIRLPNRDYGANGWYFVTICTGDRLPYFGNIINGQMQLSAIGKIARQFWLEIPNHSKYTYIDEYVIMPNHVHGIIVIDKPDRYCRDVACNVSTRSNDKYDLSRAMSQMSPKSNSLGVIIRSYKSSVTRWCRTNNRQNFAWQSRFYDRVIRKDGSLDRIRQYIINNPAKWEKDRNNSASLWM